MKGIKLPFYRYTMKLITTTYV